MSWLDIHFPPTLEQLRAAHMSLRTGVSYARCFEVTREFNRMTDAQKLRFAANLDDQGIADTEDGLGSRVADA